MQELKVLTLNDIGNLFIFIASLYEDEYEALLRQFDKVDLWAEFMQWESL